MMNSFSLQLWIHSVLFSTVLHSALHHGGYLTRICMNNCDSQSVFQVSSPNGKHIREMRRKDENEV